MLAGGYRLRECDQKPAVCLVGMGAVMPEVLAAASVLEGDGVACDVICLTSADLVFRAVQARRGLAEWPTEVLDMLFPWLGQPRSWPWLMATRTLCPSLGAYIQPDHLPRRRRFRPSR